jgi:hypothetical protein
MRIIKEKINRRGQREVTVVIDDRDMLMAFHPDRFYRLGGQVDDVVQGHVIRETEKVYWCSISQKWEAL